MIKRSIFWEPNQTWVNEINVTNLRSINGIRLAVALVLAGILAFGFAVGYALRSGSELVASQRATELALGIFDTLALFVAGLMGISVAGYGVKRVSDHGYLERKLAIKQAETKDHPAQAPVNVVANDRAQVAVTEAPAPAAGSSAPTPAKAPAPVVPPEEPDLFRDDESGEEEEDQIVES